MAATALQSDTIWLSASRDQVTALNSKLVSRLPELKSALEAGLPAYPDSNRPNFYDIELASGWAYVHVRDNNHMVYLVAYSRD